MTYIGSLDFGDPDLRVLRRMLVEIQTSGFRSKYMTVHYYYYYILLGTICPLQELIEDIRYITYNKDLPLGGPVTRVIRTIPPSG
jgi:hypothetical protein